MVHHSYLENIFGNKFRISALRSTSKQFIHSKFFFFNFQISIGLDILNIFPLRIFFYVALVMYDEKWNARRFSRRWKNTVNHINYTAIQALCHFLLATVKFLIVPSLACRKLNENLWFHWSWIVKVWNGNMRRTYGVLVFYIKSERELTEKVNRAMDGIVEWTGSV